MASADDLITQLRGIAQNLSQFTKAMGAPGRTVSAALSPLPTLVTTLGTSSLAVVGFNATRRAISFHSTDPTNNSTIFLTPLAVATIGQGVVLVPGQDYVIDAGLGCNCGWMAIAGTGSANKLLILEFV